MKKLTKILVLVLVAQICCLPMLFGASNLNSQKPSYDEVCRGFAGKVFNEYSKLDYNFALYDKAFNKWLEFAENFSESTSQADVERYIKTFESYKAAFKQPTEITLSENEVLAFRSKGIKPSEMLSHNIEFEAFYSQMCFCIDVLKMRVQQQNVSMLVEGSILGYDSDKLSLKCSYLSMLHTFSQFPDTIYDKKLTDCMAKLNYQFGIDTNLPTSEYQRMADATIQKMQRINSKLAEKTNKMGNDVMILEEDSARFDNACKALEEAFASLDGLENYLLNENDTKESARAKIEYVEAVINKLEACSKEYIDAMTVCYKSIGADMNIVEEERTASESCIASYRESIGYMKAAYEGLGFGKFE